VRVRAVLGEIIVNFVVAVVSAICREEVFIVSECVFVLGFVVAVVVSIVGIVVCCQLPLGLQA
jgi:hypothetical protein